MGLTAAQWEQFHSMGDVNRDGYIDLFDALIIVEKFGSSDPDADVNGDGVVDNLDAEIVQRSLELNLDIWSFFGEPKIQISWMPILAVFILLILAAMFLGRKK